MKYFEIVKKPQFNIATSLKNWYGSFDVRDIKMDTFYKLPKQQLYIVDMTEKQVFTDFILFPFVLMSQTVKDLVKMYGDVCFCREIILLDSNSGSSMNYYLPVFDETNQIQIHYKEFEDGKLITKQTEEKQALSLNKNIFWIKDSLTRHTIISLDFAESLLRREATGIELKEVILTPKKSVF